MKFSPMIERMMRTCSSSTCEIIGAMLLRRHSSRNSSIEVMCVRYLA